MELYLEPRPGVCEQERCPISQDERNGDMGHDTLHVAPRSIHSCSLARGYSLICESKS